MCETLQHLHERKFDVELGRVQEFKSTLSPWSRNIAKLRALKSSVEFRFLILNFEDKPNNRVDGSIRVKIYTHRWHDIQSFP